ncbi:unnamed protein product, partial [Urochloa humidicola]
HPLPTAPPRLLHLPREVESVPGFRLLSPCLPPRHCLPRPPNALSAVRRRPSASCPTARIRSSILRSPTAVPRPCPRPPPHLDPALARRRPSPLRSLADCERATGTTISSFRAHPGGVPLSPRGVWPKIPSRRSVPLHPKHDSSVIRIHERSSSIWLCSFSNLRPHHADARRDAAPIAVIDCRD